VKKTIIPFAMAIAVLLAGAGGFIAFHSKPRPHTVTLTWHEPAPLPGMRVTKYYIYRSTSTAESYVKIGSASGLKYEDSIVQSGRTYYYEVTAVDDYGHESGKSQQATATIP
jgi:fibronectin type 3 domain-containing protein